MQNTRSITAECKTDWHSLITWEEGGILTFLCPRESAPINKYKFSDTRHSFVSVIHISTIMFHLFMKFI